MKSRERNPLRVVKEAAKNVREMPFMPHQATVYVNTGLFISETSAAGYEFSQGNNFVGGILIFAAVSALAQISIPFATQRNRRRF